LKNSSSVTPDLPSLPAAAFQAFLIPSNYSSVKLEKLKSFPPEVPVKTPKAESLSPISLPRFFAPI